jgi:hypothetical protein
MYPSHKNNPIIKPGFQVLFSGIPPITAKKNAAIKYLKKTTKVGLKILSKFFTIKKVEPKNNADTNNAISDLFFSLMNI